MPSCHRRRHHAWPDKPVRLVVRLIVQKVTDDTKWTFIVDNRAGGNGNIGIDVVAKAQADGYPSAWARPPTLRSTRRSFRRCRTTP